MKHTEILIFFLLLCCFSFAAWEAEFFWGGQILVKPDKINANAGDTLNVSVKMDNLSDAPFPDAYLVFQLVHVSDTNEFFFHRENIIAEKVSERYYLRGKESRTVNIELKIPEHAPSGNYRIDAYFKNPRSYAIGVPHIFVYPYSAYLKVKNSGQERNVSIDRNSTVICGPLSELQFKLDCYSGPVGVIVEPDKEITITTVVKNKSATAEENLKLRVVFYHYDDSLQEAAIKEFTVPIDRINANSSWKKDVKVLTPSKPGAYPIRLDVVDSKGTLLSTFRHRVNVSGLSSRFVFAYADKIYYKKGDKANILVKFLSSSDARTEGKADIEVYLMKAGKKLYTAKKTVDLTQQVPIRTEKFAFDITEDLSDFVLGAISTNHENASMVLDSYEQPYVYDRFYAALSKLEMKTYSDAAFSKEANNFLKGSPVYIKVRAVDERGSEVTAEGKIFFESSGISLGPFELKNNSYVFDQTIPAGEYKVKCEAHNLKAESKIVVQEISGLIVKIYGDEKLTIEKNEFKRGETIYFAVYADSTSATKQEVPVQYFVRGEGFNVGPFAFTGSTAFKQTLPAGKYEAVFFSGDLESKASFSVTGITSIPTTPKQTPGKKPTGSPIDAGKKTPLPTSTERSTEGEKPLSLLGIPVFLIGGILAFFGILGIGLYIIKKKKEYIR
ncbi:MAG: hypothetical protein N3F05_04340 [Candidatus Diapherotrites archaeon]|nr:hypothetical protein [Candidatus Diapherotrites archaeon]